MNIGGDRRVRFLVDAEEGDPERQQENHDDDRYTLMSTSRHQDDRYTMMSTSRHHDDRDTLMSTSRHHDDRYTRMSTSRHHDDQYTSEGSSSRALCGITGPEDQDVQGL